MMFRNHCASGLEKKEIKKRREKMVIYKKKEGERKKWV